MGLLMHCCMGRHTLRRLRVVLPAVVRQVLPDGIVHILINGMAKLALAHILVLTIYAFGTSLIPAGILDCATPCLVTGSK